VATHRSTPPAADYCLDCWECGEAATNPFYAAQKLVETLGATSERRDSLGDTPSDAVVVLSTWGWDIDRARREGFERWVEAGGRLVVDAIARRDYPIIQGVIMIFAGIYVVVNLLVDLSYTFLDPRIRY